MTFRTANLMGALVFGAAAVTAAAPAQAQPVHTMSVAHPEDDYLGSQVRKHEPVGAVPGGVTADQTPGLDVSGHQGNVDWNKVKADGAKFAYVKATESTDYTSPSFSQQYNGAYDVGIIRGAYHFATPNTSGGAAQADYFIEHGGGWSADGKTLPGLLDIEWNPYGDTCYGLNNADMAKWISDFSDRYKSRAGRAPAIYTANGWWSQCVGKSGAFAAENALMLASYNSTPGTMPYNWEFQTIWQFADSGTFPGDQDRFNGDLSRVQAFAKG